MQKPPARSPFAFDPDLATVMDAANTAGVHDCSRLITINDNIARQGCRHDGVPIVLQQRSDGARRNPVPSLHKDPAMAISLYIVGRHADDSVFENSWMAFLEPMVLSIKAKD